MNKSKKKHRQTEHQPKKMTIFATMSCDDEIIKRKLYYDGLKQVIEHPIPENYAKEIDDLLQEDDADKEEAETLLMWKEVAAPVCNAIVFVHNNRFLLDEKETIINEDADTPSCHPMKSSRR